jgi:hypothetical protein
MRHAARRDVEHDEYIEPLKRDRDDQEEVAREHDTRMIEEEGGPGLCWLTGARARATAHVAAHSPRRDHETELETQLRGDTLLTPRAIGRRHVGDEPLEFDGDPWPPARS